MPDLSGWYCRLFYSKHVAPIGHDLLESKPVVADVHTSPQGSQVLEVAAGDARLLVIAIEDATQATVYVGPVYAYYEFWRPASQRLNDYEWRRLLASDSPPPRPDWVTLFEAPMFPREPENPRVTVTRQAHQMSVGILDRSKGGNTRTIKISAAALQQLGAQRNLHALDLSDSEIDDAALRHLAGLPDLRSLDLSGTKVTDACAAHLQQHGHLQCLDLSATAISDAALPALYGLRYLSQLDLRNTRVTADAVRETRRRLPEAEVLVDVSP
jgi:hypothetical protein